MKSWLFLRGEYDANNKQNIKADADMWCQLFAEIGNGAKGTIWFKGAPIPSPAYQTITHIFARGGFGFYIPVLYKHKKAYKIYYGGGVRKFPQDGIHYHMILVDCEKDLCKGKKKFPKSKVVLWTKPAARQFKPMNLDKKYDVLYVAAEPKDKRKRVKWVHKTAPKDLKILQLGNPCKAPKNFTVKRVPLIKMPKVINQCKVVICPYTKDDAAPRIIAEALNCGVPVVCREDVKHNYICYIEQKNDFWDKVSALAKLNSIITPQENTIEKAAEFIKEQICKQDK